MKKILFAYLLFGGTLIHSSDIEPWTWSLQKTFNHKPKHKNNKHIVFAYTDLKPFTQLLFSWNATRPSQGYYRFWAQVRNATSKKWYSWHKMIDWGNGVQRSFFDKAGARDTTYAHVRLESPGGHVADGVRFVITAHDGAPVSHLKEINLSLSNLNNFKSELGSKIFKNLSSVIIKNVPMHSQMTLDHPRKEGLCSPTSCSMLVSFLAKKPIIPELFAQNSYDEGLDVYGSWPFNMAHAYEACNGLYCFHVMRLHSFLSLYKKLKENIPVIVSVRGSLKDAPKEYNNGHLLVVVGYDQKQKKVIVHDPAHATSEQVCTSYDLSSFLTAWERSRRLAYIAERV